MTLPLAERLVKKLIDDNKIEAEAEVFLYLMVLEREVNSPKIYLFEFPNMLQYLSA